MKDFTSLQENLKITFKNPALLTQAFLHRSYLNEHAGLHMEHNERLEFLGDAILELSVTHYLFTHFPSKPEGELTAYRAALVNTQTISDTAKSLNFEDYLLLSRGEAKDAHGKARGYILANTFEAFIGALYLDQGYYGVMQKVMSRKKPKKPSQQLRRTAYWARWDLIMISCLR
jgi:ribonuclease-3